MDIVLNKMYGNNKKEDHHLIGDARYHHRAVQPKEERFKFILIKKDNLITPKKLKILIIVTF